MQYTDNMAQLRQLLARRQASGTRNSPAALDPAYRHQDMASSALNETMLPQQLPFPVPMRASAPVAPEITGTRNMPGTGVLLPQYQAPDVTSGWVDKLAQPINMPTMDIAGVPPSPSDVLTTRQAAPRVAPPRPTTSRIVPLQKQPEPETPYAKLMKDMEAQIGLSNSDTRAQMLASRNLGVGMAGIAPQTDLSGLYNYVNAQTGSNFKQAPDQFANRQELIEKMMGALPAGQKDIRAADMGLVKTKLGIEQSLQEAAAKAKESSMDRQLKMQIAKMTLAAAQKNAGLNLSPGQKKLDWEYAKDHNDYFIQGGADVVQTNIGNLEKAISMLRSTPEGTLSGGTITGFKSAREIYNKPSVEVQNLIEGVTAQDLKKILGGAFSERDRTFLLANQYAPNQPQEVNAARAEAIVNRLKEIHQRKVNAANYFETYKTTEGFSTNKDLKTDSVSTQQAAQAGKLTREQFNALSPEEQDRLIKGN